ncbi:MAG: type secretion system protein [Sphingomonadales bacterium]|nr:type secretion system protein [Sphingomonadales bacterium]
MMGVVFILMALPLIGSVGIVLLTAHRRDMLVLDRRMGSRVVAVAPVVRQRKALVTMPQRIEPLLAQAQIEPTPQLVAILCGVLALSFALSLAIGGLVLGLIAVAAEAALVIMYVDARARRRRDGLIDALPFYLDAVRQLMSIGNSLPQALQRALPTAADTIQSFLGPATRRIELGAPVADSMQQLADRLAIAEVAMLAAAIRVNIRFGGPMTSILNNLAQIVRERLRIKRELASATAEVKISTQLLVALPLLLTAFLLTSNQAYRDFFFNEPRGHRMAFVAAVLQGLGITLMMRMKRMSF